MRTLGSEACMAAPLCPSLAEGPPEVPPPQTSGLLPQPWLLAAVANPPG